MRFILTLLMLALCPFGVDAAGRASHVVVLVWDGMRPDFVSESQTPNLWRLAQGGTTFSNHHPVYISTTEVNGTAIATGCYPGVSGVVANYEFRPEINPTNKVATEALATVRKGDELTGGQYLKVATIAETLQKAGKRTVVVGSKGVALLQDRAARSNDLQGLDVFEGASVPPSVIARLTNQLGAFPPASSNRAARDIWSTAALTGPVLTNGAPDFSLLWLGDPDGAQHASAPGSQLALNSIRNSDAMLGRVLESLDKQGIRAKTDVFVVSDHGFSTVVTNTDIVGLMNSNGFRAFRKFMTPTPAPGDVLVIGGLSSLLYVTGHDPAVIFRTVHFLQSQPFCGVVFARIQVPGAFLLSDAKLDAPTAPDIIVSMRWTADSNTNGAPGLVYSDYGDFKTVHVGSHGSLSRYDMHNICFAAGPDFRAGFVDELPTGNVDIAPTALWILGVEPAQPVSGRPLSEALINGPIAPEALHANHRELVTGYPGPGFVWNQRLAISEVNGTVYFDEGNGAQTAAK